MVKKITWRDTLFCWKGQLILDEEDNQFQFKGSWVGSENLTLPSNEEFIYSKNTFLLKSNQIKKESKVIDTLINNKELIWKGAYLLDNGTGLDSYSDIEHSSLTGIININGIKIICFVAKGTTEFGKFISRGKIIAKESRTTSDDNDDDDDDDDDDNYELILTRRYIRDNDIRAIQSLEFSLDEMIKYYTNFINNSLLIFNNKKDLNNLFKPWSNLTTNVFKLNPKLNIINISKDSNNNNNNNISEKRKIDCKSNNICKKQTLKKIDYDKYNDEELF